jgi:hypothetical protein
MGPRRLFRARRSLPLLGLSFFLGAIPIALFACGDDPDVPPKATDGEAGSGGEATAGGAAGASGAGTGAGAGAGGEVGAGAGGTAGSSGSGGSGAAGSPVANGPTHGSARDVGVGQIAFRFGDFPFACAEHPDKPSCSASARTLVAADLQTATLVAGSTVALVGEAKAVGATPGCEATSAAFTGTFALTEVTATAIKGTLSGASAAGFDGDYVLARCSAAVPAGNAVATRQADGSVTIEGGTYTIGCATAPTNPPCGDQQRVRFTLSAAMLVPGKYPLASTPAPAPTQASSSDETANCTTSEGALTGQVEVLEVLGDRLRVRLLGTNVLSLNSSVLEALLCN